MCRFESGHPHHLNFDTRMVREHQQTAFSSVQSGLPVHRIDIDGLRALAVAVVVLFHADFLPGGFVGVDIFFVISGYLMASIIGHGLDAQSFSLPNFYIKRIRRIIPALAVVMALIAITGSLFMLPHDIKDLGRSIIAASTFTSNIWFRDIAADYFAADNVLYQPLLHSWSLSVEAQFYLIFPIIMMWARRLTAGQIIALLLTLAVLSLAYSAYAVKVDPQAAFYLLTSRMWELLAGAIVYFLPPLARYRKVFAALGLACLALTLCVYDPAMGFPGIAALLPVIGTALILYARPGMDQAGALRAVLSSRPIAMTGKISYSLYLWHWPLFVFARYNMGPDLPLAVDAGLIAASIGLAWLSWRWLEQPFLSGSSSLSLWKKARYPLMMLAVLMLVGVVVKNIVPKYTHLLLPEKVVALADAGRDYIRGDCRLPNTKGFPCRFGPAQQEPSILIWGNSFARMWMPGIDAIAHEKHQAGISAIRSSCSPTGVPDDPDCSAFNKDVLDYIVSQEQIDTIVLAANWVMDERFAAHLERLVADLNKAHKTVYFVLSPPSPGYVVPRVLALAELRGMEKPDALPRAAHEKTRGQSLAWLKSISAQYDFFIIDPTDRFCSADACPVQNEQGDVLYYDRSHITKAGAILYRDIFDPLFR